MTDFFYKFQTKKNIRNTLLPVYGFTAWFYWLVYSCSLEHEKLGYFLIHTRGQISKFTGQGAINTITFAKYLTSLFLVFSVYFTISAILSLKNKTMFDADTNREFVNCPNCLEALILKDNKETLCQNCKAKADEFVANHPIKETTLEHHLKNGDRTFEENEQLFTSVYVVFTIIMGFSLIVALFLK